MSFAKGSEKKAAATKSKSQNKQKRKEQVGFVFATFSAAVSHLTKFYIIIKTHFLDMQSKLSDKNQDDGKQNGCHESEIVKPEEAKIEKAHLDVICAALF